MTAEPAWKQGWQWRLWLSGLLGSRYDGLRHFRVVRAGVLLRCGQPRVEDLEQLRSEHGLRTVVCARGGTRHPLRGRWFGRQRRYCSRVGIRLEHMPFSDKSSPPAEIFERFLRIVRDPRNHPVLVHCEQGFHRTGVLCAAYRVAEEGWTLAAALAEMDQVGFQSAGPKRRGLIDALRDWSLQSEPRQ